MKTKKRNWAWLVLVLILATGFFSCGKSVQMHGWRLVPNSKTKTLAVQNTRLGRVLNNLTFALKVNGKTDTLKQWKITRTSNGFKFDFLQPKSVRWEITLGDSTVTTTCSAHNGVVLAQAPASDARFPARTAKEDNGVMYTALGPISAGTFHHLFDRQTDILIEFPSTSILERNLQNKNILNISIPVASNTTLIRLWPEYYNNVVGLSHYKKTAFEPKYIPFPGRFTHAATGWCSWYCYYMKADEKGMVLQTDVLADELKPYGLEYVQLDACYTRGKDANWLEWTRSSFPHGGKWLFAYIANKGLKPGLWLNAYGANYAKPAMAEKYPENFFLHDKNGHLSGACCTADTTVVRLDYSNPAVIEKHLKPLFTTLVNDWGLRYLKDAGWGTWMNFFEKNRSAAFDSTADSRLIYRKVQETIRDILGPKNYIDGCAMHEVGLGFGIYDGSRTGGDDKAIWAPPKGKKGMSMQTFFNSLFGANYLNGICWWSDPDVVMVRSPLTMEEAKTIVTSISLSGQTYMISDFMDKLPDERMALYKKTMPSLPIHAVDLFPFRTKPTCCPKPASFPNALDLKVQNTLGAYDVVALYNWGDQPALKALHFANDLGLALGQPYLVFDFWNEKFLGRFQDSLSIDVPVHGVRALLIHPETGHPKILATSRHLTAAVSLDSVRWQSDRHVLQGTANTIPGAAYTLFVYVPNGVKLKKAEANARILYHTQDGNLLKIAFQGQQKAIRWKLAF